MQKERQAEKAKLRAELEREAKEAQAAEKASEGKDAEKQASRDLPQLLQLTGCRASRQYQSARQVDLCVPACDNVKPDRSSRAS